MPIATQDDKFFKGDNLSVRQMGCACDGVTDDTVNFNLAMIAAAAKGAPLMIPGDAPLMCSQAKLPSNLTLIGRPGATIRQIGSTISSPVFTGTGLNDLTPGGIFTDTAIDTFTVAVDGTGSPNTFKWKKNSGGFTSGVSMTGAGQSLSDGVTVTFAATTGHHLGDQWVVTASPGSAVAGTPFVSNLDAMGGNSNILLQGITFDGNSSHQKVTDPTPLDPTTSVSILQVVNVTDIAIRACTFKNALKQCIFGYSLDKVLLDSCFFSNWEAGNVGAIRIGTVTGVSVAGSFSSIRIVHCKLDGRVSHSSCIKLSCQSGHTGKGIIINDNEIYVGDDLDPTTAELGVEVYCDTGASGVISGVLINDNYIEGETTSGVNVFGISCGGTGPHDAVVSNNKVKNCTTVGIELIGSYLVCEGNQLDGSGQIIANASTSNQQSVTIRGNIVNTPYWPPGASAPMAAIQVIAQNQDGHGPYSASDVVIDGNIVTGVSNSNGQENIAILVQSNGAACNIYRPTITNNHVVGPGIAHCGAISIAPFPTSGTVTGQIYNHVLRGNTIESIAIGINNAGSAGRYLWNRFNPATVGTSYNNTIQSDEMIVEIDTGDTAFTPNQLKIRGMPRITLPASGDIVLPLEAGAAVFGASAPSNPNLVNIPGVNFGSELQGGFIAVNSRWAGAPNWTKNPSSAYTRAQFLRLGAGRFGIGFGPATNANGADPQDLQAFYVDDPGSSSATPGANFNVPLKFNNSALTHFLALIVATGGSVQFNFDASAGIKWNADGSTMVQTQVNTTAGDYANSGVPGGGVGGTGSTYRQVDTGDFWNKLAGGWALLTNFWRKIVSPAGIRTDNALGINRDPVGGFDIATTASIQSGNGARLLGLTASTPVLTNGSKDLVSAQVDLGAATNVKGTGLSAGQITEWDGTKLVGIATGVNVNLTEITSGPTGASVLSDVSLSGTVPAGLTLTKTFTTVVNGFTVATHTTTNGIVTS